MKRKRDFYESESMECNSKITIKAEYDYLYIDTQNEEKEYCIKIFGEYLQELHWNHSQVCKEIENSGNEENVCELEEKLHEVIKAEIEVTQILEKLRNPKIPKIPNLYIFKVIY